MNQSQGSIGRREFLATTAACASPLFFRDPQREATPDADSRIFRAGAAVAKITPALGVSLEGYFMKLGPVTAVHDDLFARAVVLDDGRQRLALCVCDMTVIPGEFLDQAKKIVQRKTGLAVDRILIAATHTHAAPRVGLGQDEIDQQFYEMLVNQIAGAIVDAITQLSPARIGWGSIQKPDYCFNRRWWMKPGTIPPNPFGRATDRVQFNPPRGRSHLVKPAGPVDPELSFLSLQHADGRPLAILANYSIHYVGGYEPGHVSADYFGEFSRRLGQRMRSTEAPMPFVGIMSNGTSGNIGAGADFRLPPQKVAAWQRMQEIGQVLAESVARAATDISYFDHVPLEMCERDLELGVRRPDEDRLRWANAVLAGDRGPAKHRWTPYYAQESLLLNEYPETLSVKLQALRIGNLTIGAIPCEVFAETGLALKRASPTDQTFVMELANQYHGYLPTPEQHALGAYETWDARSSCLERLADAKIRAALLDMFAQVSSVTG